MFLQVLHCVQDDSVGGTFSDINRKTRENINSQNFLFTTLGQTYNISIRINIHSFRSRYGG
jgi:hypothetical protein